MFQIILFVLLMSKIITVREHSFLEGGGGGPEEFRGGSLTFCLPKKGGST